MSRYLRTLAPALSLLCSLVAGAAEPPLLNIYNWADYIDPGIISDFEAQYGIEVNYDIYDSSEIVDTKLMTGNSGYDIVVHAASFSARLAPIGVFQRVDRARLSNWHHLDPAIIALIEQQYGGDLLGVPYMWGTTGFTYNVDLIRRRMPDAPVASMDMMFDPDVVSKFADCGVSLLDDPISVIPLAMLYLGHPSNSVDPDHLEEVATLLQRIRPYIKYFSSTKMLLDLPSREVCLAMTWSGDYAVAKRRAAAAGLAIDLAYTIPREGSVNWFDIMFLPADAPHPENAHLFLNYLLRPEVIARATNFTGYANANSTANALVDPAIMADVGIYPDATTLQRLHPTLLLGPKLERRRSRVWIKLKSGL